MYYDKLPIFKSALDLVVYVETIAKGFDKYYKYTMGTELRDRSRAVMFAIQKANMEMDKREKLQALRDRCEEFRMMVYVAQEIRAFSSFKQFERCSRLSHAVCSQAQAWLNSAKKCS